MSKVFSGQALPGHGDIIKNGVAKIQEYIQHRQQREDQVLEVLKDGRSWTVIGIVKIIYADVPKNLHEAAGKGVLQILEKLVGQGKVVHREDEDRWQIGGKSAL